MHTRSTLPARFSARFWLGATAILLALGLSLGNDYGVGADEALNAMVGGRALTAYASPEGYRDYLSTGEILAQHGPAYFMPFVGLGRIAGSLLPGWLPSDGRHLVNYLCFLAGIAGFYALARRLLPGAAAAATTLLFATQPVLFGLGFINAKDTPFMALFLASLATGLWAAERMEGSARSVAWSGPEPGENASVRFGSTLRQEWGAAGRWARVGLIAAPVIAVLVLLDLLWLDGVRELVRTAAAWAIGQPALRGALSLIAQDIAKTPIEGYLPKIDWLYLAYGRIAVLLATLAAALAVGRRAAPRALDWMLPRGWGAVVLAGAVCGLAVSIRPIAGLAGLLIGGYLVHRLRVRPAALLLLYWAAAGVVAYETWPYLWEAPLPAFLASLGLHTDVAGHEVLYRGAVYAPDALPWHYLPTLFALQLTEPVLLLALVGLPAMVRTVRGGGERAALLVGAGLWLAVPLAATRLPGAGLYNGFRHVLFIVPPLLLAGGFGLAAILDRVRSVAAPWLIVGLLLAPGLWGIARLHPYEYAYFNGYAGGVSGAYGAYDQEYWCTSYREAMGYVNQVAPAGATVFFGRSMYAALPFARADLVLTNQPADHGWADYLLYCTRFREDQVWLRGEPAFEIGRGRAVFARVYRLGPPAGGQP